MKYSLFLSLFFLSQVSFARFYSPFPSTVKGICLPNTHKVGNNDYIYRSMEPYDKAALKEVLDFGIQKILIFKNPSKDELEIEKANFLALGGKKENFKIIEFPYKDMHVRDYQKYCEMVVTGLQFLENSRKQKTKTLLHCTVGEDRTGMLSGLYNYLHEPNKKLHDHTWFFKNTMCKNGYGSGNPEKPLEKVVTPIRKSLTRLYLKMAYLIEQKTLTPDKLDLSVCASDPYYNNKFRFHPKYKWESFKCSPQKVKPWICKSKNYPMKDHKK